MAFINKKTFDIIQDSNIRGYLKNYFEVDDMLAEPIQVLNRKGYVTSYSCAGHPYISVNMAHSGTEETSKAELLKMIHGTYKVQAAGSGRYRIYFKDFLERYTYIMFDEKVEFPSMPEGFAFEHNAVSIGYSFDISVYEFFNEQLQAVKRLTKWAMALPERKA